MTQDELLNKVEAILKKCRKTPRHNLSTLMQAVNVRQSGVL